MIEHNFEQNSPEWYEARIGVVTSTSFAKIITPKTMTLSSQSKKLENAIASEIVTGEPSETFKGTDATERGNELEPAAAEFYEMIKSITLKKVGFVTSDDKLSGASPDRLAGDEGLVEIKCPLAKTMFAYHLGEESLKDAYYMQVQGQLLITGRKWCDLIGYHPKLDPIIERIEPDPTFQEALGAALEQFHSRVREKVMKVAGFDFYEKQKEGE